MLARGFVDLREANPELAYSVVLDILAGINDSSSVRAHVATQRGGMLPHRRVVRRGEMTARGLVVVESEEVVAATAGAVVVVGNGVAASATNGAAAGGGAGAANGNANGAGATANGTGKDEKRSPIAELLYMRWMEGLKLKWPSIL